MLGINPYEYLKDVLARLPLTSDSELATLTPTGWKKAKETQFAQAA